MQGGNFPDGSNVTTRLQGDSQIQAMQEGRLEANTSRWQRRRERKSRYRFAS